MDKWEYSESIESDSIVSIQDKYGHFIDGKFSTPNSKKYLKTVSPSTEEVLASISIGNEKDVDKAVNAAKEGFKRWSKTTPSERAKYLIS